MIVTTHDERKFLNSNLKKIDFFVEANKLALQVLNCIEFEPTIDDKLNCIYNKTHIQLHKNELLTMIESNDIRISFINICKKRILKAILDKYNEKSDRYIMLLTPDLSE